jgi:hypothetical protein
LASCRFNKPTDTQLFDRAWPECQVTVIWAWPETCQHQALRWSLSHLNTTKLNHKPVYPQVCFVHMLDPRKDPIMNKQCFSTQEVAVFGDSPPSFKKIWVGKVSSSALQHTQHVDMPRELGGGMLTNPCLPPMSQMVN